ncbi:flagellar hook-basal body complex protein FliE [Temperatibacter marinus]|uniref:Flagellar hook-basal body complex protein FliE n=1 Tax=Temperatibacter marinus TaxID=1456591 RepID=A0AA52ECF3_9PROT|nr:flagellar hook-basal body complex protein FliE [Temperatibacter marinus]WND02145.1 flagellar hook-basal body complex protein FliE [Temperatibacter marinus]
MSIKSLDAATAYAQALKSNDKIGGISGVKGADPFATSQSDSSAFSNLIEDAIGDVSDATKASELTGAKAIANQADMVDVVTAASNAELVVSTMTAVRDKVISSYNEIIKMPI